MSFKQWSPLNSPHGLISVQLKRQDRQFNVATLHSNWDGGLTLELRLMLKLPIRNLFLRPDPGYTETLKQTLSVDSFMPPNWRNAAGTSHFNIVIILTEAASLFTCYCLYCWESTLENVFSPGAVRSVPIRVSRWNYNTKCVDALQQICRTLQDMCYGQDLSKTALTIFSWNFSCTKESENAQPDQHLRSSNSWNCLEKIWKMPNYNQTQSKEHASHKCLTVTCPPDN